MSIVMLIVGRCFGCPFWLCASELRRVCRCWSPSLWNIREWRLETSFGLVSRFRGVVEIPLLLGHAAAYPISSRQKTICAALIVVLNE